MKNLIIILALILGSQSVFAEKIVPPSKDSNKQKQGGADTGGGPFITVSPPQPIVEGHIPQYIEEAAFYLPYAIRYIDYYMSINSSKPTLYFPDGTPFTLGAEEGAYEKYIGRYKIFSSSRNHRSVYDVLKGIRFKVRNRCWDKDGAEVAASVFAEEENDVCISRNKIMDADSNLNNKNIVISLVGLMAHEVVHKVGIKDEAGPTWIQLVVINTFRPMKDRMQASYNAWEILQQVEKRHVGVANLMEKASKSPSSACYYYGASLYDSVRIIDSEMQHAYAQGMGYLSYEGYKDYLTTLHILINTSSFCLDDDDLKEMLSPSPNSANADEYMANIMNFINTKPGEKYGLIAKRETGTLFSRPVQTVRVGKHDVVNLRKALDQTQEHMNFLREEVKDLVEQSDRDRSGGTK